MTFLFFFLSTVEAADPNKAHPHSGVAKTFSNPTKAVLNASDKKLLAAGKPVIKQVQEGSGGRGIAVFDINASEKAVWDVITNFSSYPQWIDELSKTKTYKKEGQHIFVDFIISTWGVTVQYYIKHYYNPSKGYLTWQLDYSRESDLDDSTGYWLVYPSPLDPSKTRVEYSVVLLIKGWVPGFVQTMLAESGIENATKWVKREAEKQEK